jgi:uncharacterized protein (TIGR03084 family)
MTDPIVSRLVDDLAAEKSSLVEVLASLPEQTWTTKTPSPGWTIHDQVSHLAHFDTIAGTAIADPVAFVAFRDALPDLQIYIDSIGPANASRTGVQMLAWWADANDQLRSAALTADPRTRVPWFGPPMSLASTLTARLMETWAHGQDVVDALGHHRTATARLEHIARLGVMAMPNSFLTRGLDVPTDPVHVELGSPDGQSIWRWGPDGAVDSVVGPAEDFCLVVTQRRNISDVGLAVNGSVAAVWMSIAQAYAGPPGTGRPPGHVT